MTRFIFDQNIMIPSVCIMNMKRLSTPILIGMPALHVMFFEKKALDVRKIVEILLRSDKHSPIVLRGERVDQ